MCVCAYVRADAHSITHPFIHIHHYHPTTSPLLERKAKPVEKEEFERVLRALRQDRYTKARN